MRRMVGSSKPPIYPSSPAQRQVQAGGPESNSHIVVDGDLALRDGRLQFIHSGPAEVRRGVHRLSDGLGGTG